MAIPKYYHSLVSSLLSGCFICERTDCISLVVAAIKPSENKGAVFLARLLSADPTKSTETPS